jgi:hypothetical protein
MLNYFLIATVLNHYSCYKCSFIQYCYSVQSFSLWKVLIYSLLLQCLAIPHLLKCSVISCCYITRAGLVEEVCGRAVARCSVAHSRVERRGTRSRLAWSMVRPLSSNNIYIYIYIHLYPMIRPTNHRVRPCALRVHTAHVHHAAPWDHPSALDMCPRAKACPRKSAHGGRGIKLLLCIRNLKNATLYV